MSKNKVGIADWASTSTKTVSPGNLRSDLPGAGRIKHFKKNWKILTRDPQILKICHSDGQNITMFISKWRVAFMQDWRLFTQTRSKGCPFFSSTSQNFSEICEVPVERKSSRISLPGLWSGACSENFYKTYENSNCMNEAFERSVDHLCRRHLSGRKLIRGNRDVMRHIGFHFTESGVCNKLSKLHFESLSSNSIPRDRNRLLHHESIPLFTKEGTDHFAMPKSIETITFRLKANDTSNRSSFFNSTSCSFSTLKVPIFTAPTNSRVS